MPPVTHVSLTHDMQLRDEGVKKNSEKSWQRIKEDAIYTKLHVYTICIDLLWLQNQNCSTVLISTEHYLSWKTAYFHPQFQVKLAHVVNIDNGPPLTHVQTCAKHVLQKCATLNQCKQSDLEILASILSGQDFVTFCDESDNKIANFILCGEHNELNHLDLHIWI